MSYKVLIVDDQMLPRQYFESIVKNSENYELVDAIASAKVADAYCIGQKVDLVIMDIVMSDGSNGLDAARRIKNSYPDTKILVVTSMPDAAFLETAKAIPVDSFWYKEVQDAPMLEVMDKTMSGEHIWPDTPPIVRIGVAESTEFTEREMEVLRGIAKGYSNQEISEHLNMSVNTVRFHLANIFAKTGYTTRTELAIEAIQSGIVAADVK